MKKGISLAVWLRRYWISVVVLNVILYFFSQSYFLKRETEKVEKNLQNSITIAENYIEYSLEMVDNYIYEAYSNSTALPGSQPFYLLRHGNVYEVAMAKSSIITILQNLDAWSDMVEGVLFYTDLDPEIVLLESAVSNSRLYTVRSELKAFIREMFEEGSEIVPQRYMLFESNGIKYMIRVMKFDNCYFVVGVSESEVMQTIESAEYDENSIIFAADEVGNVIFSSSPVDILLSPEDEGTYIQMSGTEYLQTGYVSPRTGYYFGMLTDRQSIMAEMRQLRLAFLGLFLVFVVFIPISVYVIHKILEQPLSRVVTAMKRVEEGNLEITVDEASSILEFGQLVRAFNHMINRIKELKIENYEVLLKVQKATMQYLSLQIKPHFYANALNMIYSLAETKDFEKIQHISVAVGNYSRYMFHDATELVELKREMQHVHDYMEMQEIRYGSQIICMEYISDGLWDALIPPFIIQSFVENSVKYAFNTRRGCEIQILASLDDSENNLVLTIRDNGNGYPQTLLDKDWKQKNEEGHIGLSNVWTRMNLIYENGADIMLYNDAGAVTVLIIPYISMGAEEVEDEGI